MKSNIDQFTIDIAEYILEGELDDFYKWCRDNELTPGIINNENISHVYAKAAFILYCYGYDMPHVFEPLTFYSSTS